MYIFDNVIWIEPIDYEPVRKYDRSDLGDLVNLAFIDDMFLRFVSRW